MGFEQVHKAINMAQRRTQIVRHGIGERFELTIERGQFIGLRRQGRIHFQHRLFAALALGNVMREAKHRDYIARRVEHRRLDGFYPRATIDLVPVAFAAHHRLVLDHPTVFADDQLRALRAKQFAVGQTDHGLLRRATVTQPRTVNGDITALQILQPRRIKIGLEQRVAALAAFGESNLGITLVGNIFDDPLQPINFSAGIAQLAATVANPAYLTVGPHNPVLAKINVLRIISRPLLE